MAHRPVLVLLALPVLVAPAALATTLKPSPPPACGTVVTTDVRYTGAMTCLSGDALVAGAEGITLDLRGLSITGPGAYASGSGAGVRVPPGVDAVSVVGGTITAMRTGVVVDSATGAHVSKVEVAAADRGIQLSNAPDAVVDRNRVTGSGRDAVLVDGAGTARALVSRNVLADNVFGIYVSNGASDAVVTKNDVQRTLVGGIATFAGATGAVITRNTVSGGAGNGLRVFDDAPGVVLDKNTTTGNAGDGLQVERAGTVVARTTATDNGELGIRAVDGTVDGGGNEASGNGDPRQCTGVVCTPG